MPYGSELVKKILNFSIASKNSSVEGYESNQGEQPLPFGDFHFHHSNGIDASTAAPVSFFTGNGINADLAMAHLKRIRIFRHPKILHFLSANDKNASAPIFVSEKVTPLSRADSVSEAEFIVGAFDVLVGPSLCGNFVGCSGFHARKGLDDAWPGCGEFDLRHRCG